MPKTAINSNSRQRLKQSKDIYNLSLVSLNQLFTK